MPAIKALGYLGFAVSDIGEWIEFSESILGVSTHSRDDGGVDLRMDDYAWRIRLYPAARDELLFQGWEVSDALALEELREGLTAAGVDYEEGDTSLAAERGVVSLVRFKDPDGTPCEAFYGALQKTESPFVSPRGVSFVTGDQGLGHIVLVTRDQAAMEIFYMNVLGFRLSDYINTEVVPGRPLSITFLHCNTRHHTLALAPVPIKSKVAHIMLQTESIDDVGRAMEAAQQAEIHLSFTLGRHSNDEMLSFYALSPSGFDVEYGWGGLTVDDETWHVKAHANNSAWGHHFQRPPKN